MASTLWPSVSVRVGANVIISRRVMRCEPSDTFSDVLAKTGMCVGGRSVSRILLCKNEKFVDPVHEVPLDAPLVLCEQYGQNVCYYLTEHEQMSTHTFSPTPSVFEVLMSSSRK